MWSENGEKCRLVFPKAQDDFVDVNVSLCPQSKNIHFAVIEE